MEARDAFMLYACPSLGALLAFCMFISPMRAVLAVNRRKQLGVRSQPAAYVNSQALCNNSSARHGVMQIARIRQLVPRAVLAVNHRLCRAQAAGGEVTDNGTCTELDSVQ
jgi:hypothetical protein